MIHEIKYSQLKEKGSKTCHYYTKIIRKYDNTSKIEHFCELAGDFLELNGISEIFIKKNKLRSGETVIHFPEKLLLNGRINIAEQAGQKPEIPSMDNLPSYNSKFIGNKTILAIKVDAMDAKTSTSIAQIKNTLFGIENKKVTFKSQMSACSFNKINFAPFNGNTTGGNFISNGAVEIFVPMSIRDMTEGDELENEVRKRMEEKYGSLQNQFDHVIIILPKNKKWNFFAYAYVHHWLSVFNDKEIKFLGTIMHEIGHNLGLVHSSKGRQEYGDESGVMGFSSNLEDDEKCFNAVKSWQLGWYEDGHESINPFEKLFQGKIVGIANYDIRGNNPVILKIVGHDDNNDYYVSFNRATGINSGSTKGSNKLFITSQNSTKFEDYSHVKAILLEGESYKINNFAGSELTLQIIVDKISINKGSKAVPGYAKISMSLQNPSDFLKKKVNEEKKKKNKQSKKMKQQKKNKKKKGKRNKK